MAPVAVLSSSSASREFAIPMISPSSYTAQRSSFAAGAVQSPQSRTSTPLPRRAGAKGANKSSKQLLWALTPASTSTIDPTTLLTASDLARPVACEPPSDAKPRRRQACKNCTCGMAEREAEEEAAAALASTGAAGQDGAMEKSERARLRELAAQIERGEFTSTCGKCSMGDAFRCSGCPYRGLPAFQPGQKVELDFSSDEE